MLTQTQQKNTKGRGREGLVRDFFMDPSPVTPTPAIPTTQNSPKTNKGKVLGGSNSNPGGPPQFGPGRPSFSQII